MIDKVTKANEILRLDRDIRKYTQAVEGSKNAKYLIELLEDYPIHDDTLLEYIRSMFIAYYERKLEEAKREFDNL